MSRRDFVPFELRERHPEALEEILENRKRINDFWNGVSMTLGYTDERNRGTGHMERLKKVRRRASAANIALQQTLLTTSLHDKYLLHPLGKRKAVWDLLMALLILYSAVTVPYRIAFGIISTGVMAIVDDFVNYVFLADILVSFNTAIEDQATELLVPIRILIAKEYFKFWFWVDLVSAFPFEAMLLSFDINSGNLDAVILLKLLRLARIFKLLRVLKLGKFGKQLERLNINPIHFSALRLVLVLWFCGHTIACVWVTVGNGEVGRRTWMTVAPFGPIDHYTELETYGVSFYWVVYTVLSVGYGEFVPVNKLERVLAMCLQLSGGLVFGAMLAQVIRVLETSDPHARVYNQKMEELASYLLERNLPLALKSDVTEAYKYYLNQKSVFDEDMIMQDLPTVMLTTLVEHSYAKQFKHFGIFRFLEKSCAVNILVGSKPFQAEYGEHVLANGSVTAQLVFLSRGLVQFSTVSNMSLVTVTGYCTDGEFFGDFEYYRKTNRFMSYVAKTNCSMFSINTRALDNAFKLFPTSGKLFHEKVAMRYEHFLKAKNSNPVFNENGVCLREALWVNGVVTKNKHRLDERVARRSIEISKLRRRSSEGAKYDLSAALDGLNTVRVLHRLPDGGIGVMSEASADSLLYQGLIPPSNPWKVKWDIFIGVLIMFTIIVVPVEVGFFAEPTYTLEVLQLCIDIFFMVDLIISTRTTYIDDTHDALVGVPSMVLKKYMLTWFAVDFLSAFPFSLVFSAIFQTNNSSIKALTLLKAVRLLRLSKISKIGLYIEEIRSFLSIDSSVIAVIKLALQLWFVSHIVCCFYWFLTTFVGTYAWYDKIGIRHADLQTKYITTLYFIITTLTSVGYGDIYPITPTERVIMTVIFFIGSAVSGFIVANVRLIIYTSGASERRLSNKMADVEGYLSDKKISGPIRNVVANQLKHSYKYGSTRVEKDILSVLPVFLVDKIISIHHANTLNRIVLFQYIEDDSVVLHLFPLLTSRVYTAGDVISSQGTHATELIFLTKGAVDVVKKWKEPPKMKVIKRSRGEPAVINRNKKLGPNASMAEKAMFRLEGMSPTFLKRKSSKVASGSVRSMPGSRNGSLKKSDAKKGPLASPMSFRGKIQDDEPVWNEKILTTVRAPDFYGLISLVTDSAQTVTVRAHSSCTTFSLSETDVRSLISDNPTLALIVKDALAKAYLDQTEKLKSDLRNKRYAFLKECRDDFFDRRDKYWVSGGDTSTPGTSSSKKSIRGRRGSFQGRRGSFLQGRRGSFEKSIQNRGSFDRSTAGIQRRGSFDTEIAANGKNVLSPHSTRKRLNLGQLTNTIRSFSIKALPFLRGPSDRTLSLSSDYASQLHPDLIARMGGNPGGRLPHISNATNLRSGESMNSMSSQSTLKPPTRTELVATLERRGTRNKIQRPIPNEPNARSPHTSPCASPINSSAPTSVKMQDDRFSGTNTSISNSPNIVKSSDIITNEEIEGAADRQGLENDDSAEVPPPPNYPPPAREDSFDADNSSELKKLSSQRSFSLQSEKDSMLPAEHTFVTSGTEEKEDTLLSVDENDSFIPSSLMSPWASNRPSLRSLKMPTIPPSPAHRDGAVVFPSFSSSDINVNAKSEETFNDSSPSADIASRSVDDIEQKEVELLIKTKPRRQRYADIAVPNSSLIAKVNSRPSNTSLLSDGNSAPILDESVSAGAESPSKFAAWRRLIRVVPTAESVTSSGKTAESAQPPLKSPASGGKLSAKVRSNFLSPSTTGRRRLSVGGFQGIVGQVSQSSRKTTASPSRRSSLTAGQIVSTFRLAKRKPAFDPGRVEYGYYDSEDDTEDLIPPIILHSELLIRRTESAEDLAHMEGRIFNAVVTDRRKRRQTFPSNDINIWKAKKLLELAT